MKRCLPLKTNVPVASVNEEGEDGGEEHDGDGEDEVLAEVPLFPEGAEVAIVDVDEVALLTMTVVIVHDAVVAERHAGARLEPLVF